MTTEPHETSAGETGRREASGPPLCDRISEIANQLEASVTDLRGLPGVSRPRLVLNVVVTDLRNIAERVLEQGSELDDERQRAEAAERALEEMRAELDAISTHTTQQIQAWNEIGSITERELRERVAAAEGALEEMRGRGGEEGDTETRAVDAALAAWAVGDQAKLNGALLGLRDLFIWRIADLQVRDRYAADRRVVGEGEVADGG